MTELLFAIGIFVFMLTVYGTVMVGGHLLREQQSDHEYDFTPTPGRAVGVVRDDELAPHVDATATVAGRS